MEYIEEIGKLQFRRQYPTVHNHNGQSMKITFTKGQVNINLYPSVTIIWDRESLKTKLSIATFDNAE